MKVCIVSPHIDDAILSCGVAIQRHLAQGDNVVILNIFNAGTNADNRRQEEFKAAANIGAEVVFMDELDAPDRNPAYWSTIKLFFGGMDEVPAEYIDKVAKRLTDFFSTYKIDLAYFPLAAGNHIDHRVAYAASRRIRNAAVRYYEDRPYILWPGVLQGRMNDIGADAELPAVTRDMMLQSLPHYHYLKHFVPKGEYQDTCLPLYFAALEKGAGNLLHADNETLVATADEIRRVYDALSLYESQMPFIYPDYETFFADNMRYEKANSGQEIYAERSWTLKV